MDGRRLPLPQSPEEFERRLAAGEFLEHADYAGNRYGTLRSELDRVPGRGTAQASCSRSSVQGARQVREALPEAVPGLHRAAVDRGAARRDWSVAAPTRRSRSSAAWQVASDELAAAATSSTHVIVNDDLEGAVEQLAELVATLCERANPRRLLVIKPRLDTLLERVDSHYAVVLVAAKRARQINSYYHNLGEGTFDEYPPPMVETGSKNYLKISLEEIAAGKIKYRYRIALQRSLSGALIGTMCAWRASSSASPGGSPPTRRSSSCASLTKAGHAVRVVQTPGSLHFVGRATFEGITGAPVLVDEFEPDPARGAYPGDPQPEHDADLPPGAGAPRGRLRDRAGLGQHARQARRRPGRQPAHQRRAGLHRAAGRRARR